MRVFFYFMSLVFLSPLWADPVKMPSVWIKAKSFEYDKIKNTFFAYDNIHLIYNKDHKISELFCDKMIYEKETKKVYAIGHVFLKDHEGNMEHSESLEINSIKDIDNKNSLAKAENLSIVLAKKIKESPEKFKAA